MENHLTYFKYSLNQVELSTEAGGGRERETHSAEQILLISEEELSQCCVYPCVRVRVRACDSIQEKARSRPCPCAHLTVQRAVIACVSVTSS